MASANSDAFRTAMRHYPTGVTVVTAIGEDGPSGLTATAVASLSLDPVLMLVCFDRGSRTLRSVEASGRFAVNVLGVGQEDVALRFAGKPPQPEKWEEVGWSEVGGCPMLEGSIAFVACELRSLAEGGDHLIGVGAVTDVEVPGGEPLVWQAGAFRRLA